MIIMMIFNMSTSYFHRNRFIFIFEDYFNEETENIFLIDISLFMLNQKRREPRYTLE
jgi:hypothetical protein